MEAFVLVFVIRMAGAVMEQKENAEASLKLSEDRFRSLIHHSSDVTMVIDEEGLYTYLSPSVTDLLGYTPEELMGLRAVDFVHDDDPGAGPGALRPRRDPSVGFGVSAVPHDAPGRYLPHVSEAVITDQRDRPSVGGYVSNVRDITERKDFEALLEHQALHDPLTGLANRVLTVDRAEQMLLRSRRTGEPVSLCYIDLDNFKDTNDSLGHEAGDRLLQAVADRFTGILRSSDTVGRLGGDEFVIPGRRAIHTGRGRWGGRAVDPQRPAPTFPARWLRGSPDQRHGQRGALPWATRPSAQELLRDADVALPRPRRPAGTAAYSSSTLHAGGRDRAASK